MLPCHLESSEQQHGSEGCAWSLSAFSSEPVFLQPLSLFLAFGAPLPGSPPCLTESPVPSSSIMGLLMWVPGTVS